MGCIQKALKSVLGKIGKLFHRLDVKVVKKKEVMSRIASLAICKQKVDIENIKQRSNMVEFAT